jgi:hypothetical protein
MSKVISFRLDPNNPREAQALGVLLAKREDGYSTRDVLTDALIEFGGHLDQDTVLSTGEIRDTLEQVIQLLQRVGEEQLGEAHPQMDKSLFLPLNDDFLSSVRQAAKPGTKILN